MAEARDTHARTQLREILDNGIVSDRSPHVDHDMTTQAHSRADERPRRDVASRADRGRAAHNRRWMNDRPHGPTGGGQFCRKTFGDYWEGVEECVKQQRAAKHRLGQ